MKKVYNNNKTILDFCLYLFIASFPFKLIFTPITFAILVIAFLFLGDKKDLTVHLRENKVIFLLTLFYSVQVLGLFFSYDFGISYNRINAQLFLLLIPLVFVILNLKQKQIETSKTVFVFSWVIFCVLAFITLIYNLVINYQHRLDYNFVQSSMYHFHYPYDVLHINAAYILLLFTDKLKRFRLAISFLFFAFIVLSGVRIGMLLFALVTVIFIALNIKRFLNLKSLFVTILAVSAGLVLIRNSRYVNDKFFDSLSKIGFNTEKYVSEIGEEYHKLSLRQKLWSSAREALKSSPNLIIGYGPKGSRDKLNTVYLDNEFNNIQEMNSHNQYLTTLLNNGILGTMLLLLIFFYALYCSFKVKSLQNALLISIMMLAFITESMLERQKGVIFFAFFLTLIFLEKKQETIRR